MNKITSIIVVVILIILVVIGTRKNSALVNDKEPIKIGVMLPMTGIAADYGENQSKAIKMAIEEINNKGGVLNRHLAISLQDDATDPKQAISAYQLLTDTEKVPIIIGADWDIMASAVLPLLPNKKVVVITPTSPPDILENLNQYFFTTIAPVSAHAGVVEKYLRTQTGKKVAIIYVNGGWGQAHRDLYRKAAASTGKTVVSESVLSEFDGNDMQRAVTLLKASKPDIILASVNKEDGKNLINKNSQLGLGAKVFGHYDLATGFNDTDTTNLKGTVIYKLGEPSSEFVANFKKQFGKNPSSDADKAYDAVRVIAKAIEMSKDASASGILSGLKKVSDFQGVANSIDYTKANWPTVDTAYLEIFDGKSWVPHLNK